MGGMGPMVLAAMVRGMKGVITLITDPERGFGLIGTTRRAAVFSFWAVAPALVFRLLLTTQHQDLIAESGLLRYLLITGIFQIINWCLALVILVTICEQRGRAERIMLVIAGYNWTQALVVVGLALPMLLLYIISGGSFPLSQIWYLWLIASLLILTIIYERLLDAPWYIALGVAFTEVVLGLYFTTRWVAMVLG